MNWNSLGEFLALGGYGRYVWSAYGVLALAVIVEVAGLRARTARARRVTAALAGRGKRPVPPA